MHVDDYLRLPADELLRRLVTVTFEESDVRGLGIRKLRSFGKRTVDAMELLVVCASELPKAIEVPGDQDNPPQIVEGDDVLGLLAAALVLHFDWTAKELRCRETRGSPPDPWGKPLRNAVVSLRGTEPEDDVGAHWAYRLFVFYTSAAKYMSDWSWMRESPLPDVVPTYTEEIIHLCLSELVRTGGLAEGALQQRASLLAADRIAADLVATYRADRMTQLDDWRRDPYGFVQESRELRTRELQLLAERAPSMAERYGATKIAGRFEQQLAQLFRSFGAWVVKTRTGDRSVDLLCMWANGDERLLFLVEAKTTARPYGLPSRDQRALAEYIYEVRRSSGVLPPLAFALLMGPSATDALGSRLQMLASELRLPMWFLSASSLAALREGLAGPLNWSRFRTLLNGQPSVASQAFIHALIEEDRRLEQAHEQFVREILPARGAGIGAPTARSLAEGEENRRPA